MEQMSFVLDPASLLSVVRLVSWNGLERDLYIYRSCSCAKKISAASSNGKCGIFALGGKDRGNFFYENSILCFAATYLKVCQYLT
jgi:hypothetical protein